MKVEKAVELDLDDLAKYKNLSLYTIDQAMRAIKTFLKTRHKNEVSFWKGRYYQLFIARFKDEVDFSASMDFDEAFNKFILISTELWENCGDTKENHGSPQVYADALEYYMKSHNNFDTLDQYIDSCKAQASGLYGVKA